jgi:uncharacterized membrane protein
MTTQSYEFEIIIRFYVKCVNRHLVYFLHLANVSMFIDKQIDDNQQRTANIRQNLSHYLCWNFMTAKPELNSRVVGIPK